ncbi:MAG: O-antigen ligase family protein, partial [Elusimicrobiota bacterium]|nr:O-antigen ligase family protein [Elusimicrobiota bacterium]
MLPIVIFTLTVFLGGGKLLWQFSIVALTILLSYILLLQRDPVQARRSGVIKIPENAFLLSLLILLWSIIVIFTTKCLYSHLKNTLQIVVYIMFFILSMNYYNYKLTIVVIPLLGIIQSCTVLLQRIFHYTPYGLFPDNPNFVSGFVAAITLFSIGYLLFYRDELQSDFKVNTVRNNPTPLAGGDAPSDAGTSTGVNTELKIIMIVSGILGVVTVFLSSSRSVIIGFVLCLGYFICQKFKFKGFIAYSLLLILLFAAFGDMIFTKYVKLYDPFAFYRLKLWSSAIRMTQDYPIYGVGLGNYGRFFPRYNFPVSEEVIRFSRYTDFAHNEYLQIASELGLPALFFLLLLIWNVLKTAYRNSWVFIPVLLLLFQGFFDLNLHLPANVFLIALFIASSFDKKHKIIFLPKIPTAISILLLCVFFTFNLTADLLALKKKYLLATKFNPINSEYYYLAQKYLD